MAKAFWLNDRPTWASGPPGSALGLRANYPEAQLLLGDLAYDSEVSSLDPGPREPGAGERAYGGRARRLGRKSTRC